MQGPHRPCLTVRTFHFSSSMGEAEERLECLQLPLHCSIENENVTFKKEMQVQVASGTQRVCHTLNPKAGGRLPSQSGWAGAGALCWAEAPELFTLSLTPRPGGLSNGACPPPASFWGPPHHRSGLAT